MACTTPKRSLEFDPVHKRRKKRQRCVPMGVSSSSSPPAPSTQERVPKLTPGVQSERYRNYSGFSTSSLLNVKMLTRNILGDPSVERNLDYMLYNSQVITSSDICCSIRMQLMNVIKWARAIPAFTDLPLDDQVTLLRAHAGEHLLLGLARRSLHLDELLVLGINRIITTYSKGSTTGSEFHCSQVSTRVMDELVRPLSELKIDETEFSCLWAIVFFDPRLKSLKDPIRLKNYRFQIQNFLEEHMNGRLRTEKGRFSELLLILPALQSIARQMVEQLQSGCLTGVARIDSLTVEMLLGGSATDESSLGRESSVPEQESAASESQEQKSAASGSQEPPCLYEKCSPNFSEEEEPPCLFEMDPPNFFLEEPPCFLKPEPPHLMKQDPEVDNHFG